MKFVICAVKFKNVFDHLKMLCMAVFNLDITKGSHNQPTIQKHISTNNHVYCITIHTHITTFETTEINPHVIYMERNIYCQANTTYRIRSPKWPFNIQIDYARKACIHMTQCLSNFWTILLGRLQKKSIHIPKEPILMTMIVFCMVVLELVHV